MKGQQPKKGFPELTKEKASQTIRDEPKQAVDLLVAYAAFFLSRLLRGSSFEEAAQAAARGSSLTLSRFGGKIDSADFRRWGA